MGENSKIEWTDHTFNPWWGCVKVSPGCKNCYASNGRGAPYWGADAPRKFMADSTWKNPVKWNEKAEKEGVRHKVFCGSMCDVFEDRTDLLVDRDRLFDLVHITPNLNWQLLTRRPENVLKMIPYHWNTEGWPDNAWIGTSLENQDQEQRVIDLLKIPAKVRFLSCEPLLGEVDLRDINGALNSWSIKNNIENVWEGGIHWVIAGGESGPSARPMHPDWARSLRDQCVEAGVPFFFKQWGGWVPPRQIAESERYKIGRGNKMMWLGKDMEELAVRVGKKKAGRMLDGEYWNQFPESEAENG